MKNLKGLLGLGLISVVAFAVMGNVNAATTIDDDVCSTVSGSRVYAKLSDGQYGCFATISTAMNDSRVKNGSTFVLLDDYNNGGVPATISKDITLDLNGHTYTATDANGYISVGNGADLTIKNGKLAATTADSIIKIANTSSGNTVTIDKSVTVDGSNLNNAVIDGTGITKDTTININGTWTNIDNEVIDCNTHTGDLTINLSADIKGADTLVGIDAGQAIVNVNGGKYTTTTNSVFTVTDGTLNVKGGEIIGATSYSAIKVDGADAVLNISAGTITGKGTNGYSIRFANGSAEGEYSITGGTFTSGKDSDGEPLPAIVISDSDFLDENGEFITGGTFINGVVGNVPTGASTWYEASAATKALIKGEYATNNGTVTVGKADTTTEPGETPGDETTDNNPQTYDGIMSYVTLAISSLGALGFATKKVLF